MASASSLYDISAEEIQKMAVLAIEAKDRAYCPYSNFRVGSSILVSDPVNASSPLYYTGSNVEIASTPVGICAERCAIAPVVAGINRPVLPVIRAIAVSVDIWPPTSPCGMCRQFIREFCEPEVKVFMYGRQPGKPYANVQEEVSEECLIRTVGELLPLSFGPNDMAKRESKGVAKIG